MPVYIALLRAVNVGGTGKLAMKELVAICSDLRFRNVRTYIQSGNVVFESRLGEDRVRRGLESALEQSIGKRIDVIVRTAAEMKSILEHNPFPDAPPAKVAVVFQQTAPSEAFEGLATPGGEQVQPGSREIYVHYPGGMGRSKLKLPTTGPATVRNIGTVAKLVEMATA